jgi:hypothetical protein
MILDSVAGLNRLHGELKAFLGADSRTIRLLADQSGSAAPYEALLPALEVEKNDEPIEVTVSPGYALRIVGSAAHLFGYIDAFHFRGDEDGSHHHPDNIVPNLMQRGTLSIIVEADGTL